MMICDADFDELFPRTARPFRRYTAHSEPASPDRASLARWQDDGGKTPAAPPQSKTARALHTHHGFRLPNPARAGIVVAMMPGMAAFGATSAMLAAYERMKNA